ncbi:MAG: hypothetical protein AAF197_12780 [Pseudomonadota bacterium]
MHAQEAMHRHSSPLLEVAEGYSAGSGWWPSLLALLVYPPGVGADYACVRARVGDEGLDFVRRCVVR